MPQNLNTFNHNLLSLSIKKNNFDLDYIRLILYMYLGQPNIQETMIDEWELEIVNWGENLHCIESK